MKRYPDWNEFPTQYVVYGSHAPFCGIGVYTVDHRYSWPDLERVTPDEFKEWCQWVISQGYEIPEKYLPTLNSFNRAS